MIKIYAKTFTSFATPIDMERIVGLTTNIDNIVDKIENFISQCDAYRLTNPDIHMLKFVNLLKETSLIINEDIALLGDAGKNKANMKELNEKIRSKEREGDEIFKYAVKELFKSNDAIHIIKMMDIYNTLEDAMDACKDVANEISNITGKLLA